MADKISANITYLDSNQNKGSKAITDINPTADNSAIKDFCTGLLGLTTNTLSQIERVEKTDITNATEKPKLTLEVDNTELAKLAVTSEGTSAQFAYFPMGFNTNTLRLDVRTIIWEESGNFYVFDPTAPTSRYIMAGFASHRSIGAACRFVEEGAHEYDSNLTVDFYFSETNTTAATHYQLKMTKTAGQATFVQL